MNGISVNTSENVADSQTRQRVGSESAWDTGEIKCDLCEFGTKNKFGLKIPFLKKHSTAKFKCLTCDFTSMSHCELVEHNDRCYYYHRIGKVSKTSSGGSLVFRGGIDHIHYF